MRKLRLLIRYWGIIGKVLAFVETADKATEDGKILRHERAQLMGDFWAIIDATKKAKK